MRTRAGLIFHPGNHLASIPMQCFLFLKDQKREGHIDRRICFEFFRNNDYVKQALNVIRVKKHSETFARAMENFGGDDFVEVNGMI